MLLCRLFCERVCTILVIILCQKGFKVRLKFAWFDLDVGLISRSHNGAVSARTTSWSGGSSSVERSPKWSSAQGESKSGHPPTYILISVIEKRRGDSAQPLTPYFIDILRAGFSESLDFPKPALIGTYSLLNSNCCCTAVWRSTAMGKGRAYLKALGRQAHLNHHRNCPDKYPA